MGAIEHGREHFDRVTQATKNLDRGLRRLARSVCGVDGTALTSTGVCEVCGRTYEPPAPDLAGMSPAERRAAIESGIVPPTTEGLTEQEQRNAAFWQRRHRDTARTPGAKPSRAERAAKFMRDEISYGPNGERIVTKRLVDLS